MKITLLFYDKKKPAIMLAFIVTKNEWLTFQLFELSGQPF